MGGNSAIRSSTQIIEYEGKLVFQCFARDIEKYQKTEAALRKLNKDLEVSLQEKTAQLQESEKRFRSIANQIEN